MNHKISIIKTVCLCLLLCVSMVEKAEAQSGSSTVINAGVSGNNTVDLLKRIQKDCLSHQPDLTILMVGTNDMNSVKHVPLTQYKINLEKIVALIKQSKSKVLLLNVLPMYEPYLLTRHPASFYEPEGPSGRLKMVNEAVKKIAKDKNVVFFGHQPCF